MIRIRRAEPADSIGIARVHVAAWRSAYAGILPDDYLARLSVPRQSLYYRAGLDAGHSAWVAEAGSEVVGFATAGRARCDLADGEIETLYVLDDWRERGLGRGLMQGAARRLARAGCRSAFLWVLRDNPSRWFYQHLGGKHAADSQTLIAGVPVPKTAYVWDPIDLLLTTPAQS
ncbi:MAG TPA: GNAT family N-acetyltransferase [Acetobacteraceae bacterium]|nr:GNAT family N-acetyltransferase [Acetobacteraceae bacterium]